MARLGLLEDRLSSRLGSSQPGSARDRGLGSIRLVSRLGLLRLSLLFGTRLIWALGSARLGARLGARDQLNARLGSARSSARVSARAQMGLCSGIGIRLGLAQGSARFTCLDLVRGIGSGLGSAWKLGLARSSGLCSSLGAQNSDSCQSMA